MLDSRDRGLRIGWIGTAPRPGNGASGAGWLLLREMAAQGHRFDVFASGHLDELGARFDVIPGVRAVGIDSGWRYGRWYSRRPESAFITQLGEQSMARRRLAERVLLEHRRAPYDALYQFSTIETFGLRGRLQQLPPLVVHPQTHAAGELRWMRRERDLAAECTAPWRLKVAEGVMSARAFRQQRDIQLATRVIAISRRFGEHLVADYGVAPAKISVARSPIDLNCFRPRPREPTTGPLRIAFVGRMVVRKGVELIVALTHRLDDLAGKVAFDLVGDHSLWSDYRPLLSGLNPRLATFHGSMPQAKVADLLGQTDLLIQPAKYEPFGLTLAEALAAGVPVVASDEIGAAEDISHECCLVFPSGDLDAFEATVREMISRLSGDRLGQARACARAEAERMFAPERAAEAVVSVLRQPTMPRRISPQLG